MNPGQRTLLIFGLPVATVYTIWAVYMTATGSWGLFLDNYYMTITMIFGSFIAGSTSEGGGAVAYPVMTLIFQIPAAVARNFSFAIQSIGMTAATLWIIARRVPVERNYLWLALTGGTVGVIFSMLFIAPHVPPPYAKMMFVSLWLAFGFALFWINFRSSHERVTDLDFLTKAQRLELLFVGFVGGCFSGILGNGIDICTFAYVTMRYGLSEKIGTPTSVILMASNAVAGFLAHAFYFKDMQPQAINYWLVCIPVVMFGAPLGAFVVTHIPRSVIAYFLCAVIVVQFIGALFILKPTGMLLAFSAATFALGMLLFFSLTVRRLRSDAAAAPSSAR